MSKIHKNTQNTYAEIKQGKRPKFKQGNPGKPKGSANKFTDLKQAYLDVFDQIEKKSLEKESAIKSFFQWATKNDKNQGMFYQMVAKMLPTNMNVEGNLSISYQLSEKFMPKTDNEKK